MTIRTTHDSRQNIWIIEIQMTKKIKKINQLKVVVRLRKNQKHTRFHKLPKAQRMNGSRQSK